jgi:hypothetical protein
LLPIESKSDSITQTENFIINDGNWNRGKRQQKSRDFMLDVIGEVQTRELRK